MPTDRGDEVIAGRQETLASALERARAAMRELGHERRDAILALGAAQRDLGKVVGAAVDALETVEATLVGCIDQVPTTTRSLLRAATASAWQGLEAAGVARDGGVGEVVDLGRHRVVKELRGEGKLRVLEVVEPGIVFRGARLRPAVVVAAREERNDGARRD